MENELRTGLADLQTPFMISTLNTSILIMTLTLLMHRAAHGFVRGPLKQAALVSRPLFRPVARHVPSLSQIRGLTSEESSTTSLNIANPPAQTNGEIVHGVDEIDVRNPWAGTGARRSEGE